MSIVETLLRIHSETEVTPHKVVLHKDGTEVVLAPGSEISTKYGWGVESVTVEEDGDFVYQKKGPNISWFYERLGKLRKNSAIGLQNGSLVSSEPIKK
jgi:hypothetical protein